MWQRIVCLACLVSFVSLAFASPSPRLVSWADLSPEQQAAISSMESSAQIAAERLEDSAKLIDKQAKTLKLLTIGCITLSLIDLGAVTIALIELYKNRR